MLGPLEVRTDDSGSVLDVGGSRLRALLIDGHPDRTLPVLAPGA
jgi:hypothetical protein